MDQHESDTYTHSEFIIRSRTHTDRHTRTHAHARTHARTAEHTHTHARTHTHAHTAEHTHTHARTLYIYIYIIKIIIGVDGRMLTPSPYACTKNHKRN